ncbi:methylmalonyl Co-A mutase-associated GTPase MeaB [Desulfosporosinus sp. BICA1-9]|uniref:methylmalonyl Co-A mutase-associated GTPase MeaB n=1 Tax=Desulfosporosinus sp. BICA1-9 TaxID=1531958 RepID=UPI00054C7EDE|nr:methylmalonyl Co-A mutase-associated GTPase MeaB [Desulfosporosinus sp. BICA1-9]KJS46204.1 MAG: GTPase [Peptococcaceae bacterium BRH_c23]KJS84100.1 MAG: GTPase [Desulfosporosinus sp. BICA1-9]HBW34836.1 methylmalonyl Co-A mutase-associated GTPase MeaB [Desulfosporosinus sp.]
MNKETLDQWIARLFDRDRRAVAKLISWVEDDVERAYIMRSVLKQTGHQMVVGITGPPGAGKSSLVEALTKHYRVQDERVGIVAVDPSSPYSGGAILGDRIRMQAHGTDRDVFIRSMGTRGHLGGVTRSTADVLRILEGGGYGRLLLETVGVGQSELEIMQIADTVVVVLNPGTGDGIQAIKAGIMEVADVFVVNKSDLPGAERMKNDIEMMLNLSCDGKAWRPPVVLTSVLSQNGVEILYEKIGAHQAYLRESGQKDERRKARLRREVWRHWEDKLQEVFENVWEVAQTKGGEMDQGDSYELAERLWEERFKGGQIG